ncbi:MAG: hypothetical protein JXA18_05035 [Chitinispirillaceae bacterium]|nr:hypothetical protein [Chitinispirillaceae bacterium]
MKEVVNEILAAEKRVEQTLSDARRKAAEIRQESEKEVAAIIAAAHEEAQRIIRETSDAARMEAETRREKALNDIASENRVLRERSRGRIDDLIDEIVSLISAPAFSETQR